MLLTLGLVAVVRPFREVPSDERAAAAETPSGGIESIADVADLTTRLRPAIAQVAAHQPGGGDSWGSGVIFREDGMMLTTHHLVEGADAVRVVLDDGRELEARVVGADRETDIAVVDLAGDHFPTAPLAEGRGTMTAGQAAITIGAPRSSLPSGPLVRLTVVSATGQEAGVDGRRLVDMLRIDTAMAPGCDGGAVVDRHGNVIGISAMNVSNADGQFGYATPIDVAKAVADELMRAGRVRRSWIGVEGATGEGGVIVASVLPDSPASASGIEAGDVIVAVDDRPIVTMAALVVHLRTFRPGRPTTLVVLRSGDRRSIAITLGERPA